MTENPSTPPLDDELLSAYVDGELNNEERAQVEARLAADPQAQQFVDELRKLSQQLQDLPTEAVDEDLRSKIMQRAEREMLVGSAPTVTPADRESSGTRRWLWAAMALAATVLLSLVLPNTQQEERPVASAEPPSEERTDSAVRDGGVVAMVDDEETIAAGKLAEEGDVAEFDGEESFAEKPTPPQPRAAGGEFGLAAPPTTSRLDSSAASQPAPAAAESRAAAMAMDLETGVEAFDVSRVACEVHIALGDGKKSLQQVDQFMVQNGITLPEQRAEADIATDSVASTNATREPSVDENEILEDTPQLILVEAPLENIEATLKACNTDAYNCRTIRVVDKQQQNTPPVNQLRQWERDPDQAKFDEVVKQYTLNQRSQVQQFAKRQSNLAAGGPQLQQRFAQSEPRSRMALSGRKSSTKTADEAEMRVLFVLQQAADLRKAIRLESAPESTTD